MSIGRKRESLSYQFPPDNFSRFLVYVCEIDRLPITGYTGILPAGHIIDPAVSVGVLYKHIEISFDTLSL